MRFAAICFVALALALQAGCRRPADVRRLCEKKCACGCDVEACVRSETARRDRFRINEACSAKIDRMTECEIEHGVCIQDKTGHVGMLSDECGQLLGELAGCGTSP